MTQTSTNPTRVIIVDGHPVFAEALAIAIEATGELTCVGTADDIAFPDAEGNFPVSVLEKRYEGEGIFQELEELADRNELERAPLPPARRRPKK